MLHFATLSTAVDSEAARACVTMTDPFSIMKKSDESQFFENMTIYLKTLALILKHFLKFLLKCFLRASEKQCKQKTSAKFMHAWKCGPTQQKFSGLCSPGRVFLNRSEERRVGKECRSLWSACH